MSSVFTHRRRFVANLYGLLVLGGFAMFFDWMFQTEKQHITLMEFGGVVALYGANLIIYYWRLERHLKAELKAQNGRVQVRDEATGKETMKAGSPGGGPD